MAAKAYKVIDRRSASGWVSSNTLIETATQTTDRGYTPPLDDDIHRTVSNLGRRTLMTLGRSILWRFPALMGMVLEQANLAVSSFIPQYTGRNRAWGDQAEGVLREWHKVMDVAGWPYDYDSFLQQLVIAPIVEGETFTLLTETSEGYPLIQMIPAHRVGKYAAPSDTARVRYQGTSLWIDGVLVDDSRPYPVEGSSPSPSPLPEGGGARGGPEIVFTARIVDGVILDNYGRPIAYRLDEDYQQAPVDVAARNMFPAFCPITTGQVRGFSLLASSVFDWQDLAEWRRFEMLAQKVFSTRTLIETNESGDEDEAKSIIQTAATFDADGKKTTLDVQRLYGGTIQYLKAKTGSSVQAFGYDRPGTSSREFLKTTLRDAFRGTEWDMFFSLDPQAVGGAPMRVIVEKINSVLGKRRKLVRKCCLRVDGYAVAKFMMLGLLPWDDDWYQWDYQGPADLTADKKYDSDVDIQEIGQGLGTRKLSCARRGLYLEDVDAQREIEADAELERAGRLARKHGISLQEALMVLRPPRSSSATLSSAVAEDEPAGAQERPPGGGGE
jgi:hypothetical protein